MNNYNLEPNYTMPVNLKANHHNSYETISHQPYNYNSGPNKPKMYKAPINQAGYYNHGSNYTSSYEYNPDQFDSYNTQTRPSFKYKQENDEPNSYGFRPEQSHFYQAGTNQPNLYNSDLNQDNAYNSADHLESHQGIYLPDSDPVSEYKLDLNQVPVSEESFDLNDKEQNGNDYKYRNHVNRSAQYQNIKNGQAHGSLKPYLKSGYTFEPNRPSSYDNEEAKPQFKENQYNERPQQDYIIRVISSNKPSSTSYSSKSAQANYDRYSPPLEAYQPVIITETSIQSDDSKSKPISNNLLKAYNDAKSKVNFGFPLGHKTSPLVDPVYQSPSSSQIPAFLTRSSLVNKTAIDSSLTKPRPKPYHHHIVPSIIYVD